MTFTHFFLLVTCTLPTLVAGVPIRSTSVNKFGAVALIAASRTTHSSDIYSGHRSKRANDVYRMYSGNGQSSWPEVSTWVSSFDEMFNANKAIMKASCTQFNVPNNSDQETTDIGMGIIKVAEESGIDARFILAVLLQESNGCVRAPTTNNGVRNPGLMQDHDGPATCNEGGIIKTPCPADTIVQMIRDGVAGTTAGDGLQQTFAKAPAQDASKYYGAARIYNSGTIATSGDLEDGVATHCYSSDIANRLTGWVFAQKACTLDGAPAKAANVAPSTASESPSGSETSSPDNVDISQSQPQAETSVSVAAPTPSSPAPTQPISDSRAPGVATNCHQYYKIQEGDMCYSIAEKFGITFETLRTLNTQLDASCSNLWKGYDYCVKVT